MVNTITSVFQQVQQSVLDFPRDQLLHRVVFEGRRSVVLDRGDPGLGKHDDLNFHEGPPRPPATRHRLPPAFHIRPPTPFPQNLNLIRRLNQPRKWYLVGLDGTRVNESMDMKSVQDLKAFLPAENHPLAKQFYLDLIPHIADDRV
jgi:hypothetical protein